MRLVIDGHEVTARPGQSLLDIIRPLGLVHGKLSSDPLAARIAGEVFTLNYVPVRLKDAAGENPNIRQAMAASGGAVHLLRYSDPLGKDAYVRTAQFVIFLALHRLWPKASAKMDCTLGPGLYIEVKGASDFCVQRLKNEIARIVAADIPLLRRRVTTAEAIAYFDRRGDDDKARLLQWWPSAWFDVYVHDDFWDYHYGEMAPSTGHVRTWDVRPSEGGFLFLFPDDQNPDRVGTYEHMPHFLSVFNEGERWCGLMECETVADLNGLVESGRIRELIRVNEALHEKRYSQVADRICERGAKAVMLAGPSSSGKTTSANRLATQLRVHGKQPILMSLDDYYIDRDKIVPGPDGKLDLEHIDTIDVELFKQQMGALLRGEDVELPTFDFKTGRRAWMGHHLRLRPDSVIIVEGLHALNPRLQPEGMEPSLIFRLYVSPLLPLNLDDHNRIPTSYLRLLRRIVRDYETRGASVQHTMSMWDSVRRGEKRWIYPFQENADMIFNSSTLYELAVLKKHIYPLLVSVGPGDPWYDDVRAVMKILDFVREADVDDEIPPTSLIREFIGGNSFYRK